MKNKFFALALSIVATIAFTSCLDDDNTNHDKCIYPSEGQAIVTVRPTAADGTFYMQLNDSVRFYPRNLKSSPYGDKELRALILYADVEQRNSVLDYDVNVYRMDSILTKQCAKNLGAENVSTYGSDPVTISSSDWMTIAEDGYLTLRFMTSFSGDKKHLVNLVAGTNPDDPYELTFYHNAFGDVNGHPSYGLVAFKLSDLPDTNGKTVDLTLKWKSYDGDQKMTLKYCTRKPSGTADAILSNTEYDANVE